MTSTCDRCGQIVQIGDYPFCPHGPVRTVHVQDDTIPGGARWMHNLGHEPVWIETKTELAREMQARELVFAERKAYNRSDRSPWTTRNRLRPGQRDPFVHPTGFNDSSR